MGLSEKTVPNFRNVVCPNEIKETNPLLNSSVLHRNDFSIKNMNEICSCWFSQIAVYNYIQQGCFQPRNKINASFIQYASQRITFHGAMTYILPEHTNPGEIMRHLPAN